MSAYTGPGTSAGCCHQTHGVLLLSNNLIHDLRAWKKFCPICINITLRTLCTLLFRSSRTRHNETGCSEILEVFHSEYCRTWVLLQRFIHINHSPTRDFFILSGSLQQLIDTWSVRHSCVAYNVYRLFIKPRSIFRVVCVKEPYDQCYSEVTRTRGGRQLSCSWRRVSYASLTAPP